MTMNTSACTNGRISDIYLRVVDHADRVGEVLVVSITFVVGQTVGRQGHLDLVKLVLSNTDKLETN